MLEGNKGRGLGVEIPMCPAYFHPPLTVTHFLLIFMALKINTHLSVASFGMDSG